jgi:hypothetical protein
MDARLRYILVLKGSAKVMKEDKKKRGRGGGERERDEVSRINCPKIFYSLYVARSIPVIYCVN